MIKQRSNLTLPVSLYAIGNVKDELNLHTGELTHRIGKIVFDGTENWQFYSATSTDYGIWQFYVDYIITGIIKSSAMSNITMYGANVDNRQHYEYGCYLVTSGTGIGFQMAGSKDIFTDIPTWKQYLASEYAAGTPVTVWYILAEPTTEIVTVPEGLSGIVEGYLTQSSTPTPQNPIYPTSCDSVDMWNEVMYRQYGVNETLSPIPTTVFSQGDGIDSCTVYGNTVQNGTPTPTDPVDIYGVGVMSENLFDKSTARLGYYINDETGDVSRGTTYNTSVSMPIDVEGFEYIYPNTNGYTGVRQWAAFYDGSGRYISGFNGYNVAKSVPSNAKTVRFTVSNTYIDAFSVNAGPSPLPYEPYGYKVGLDIDSHITNIYLGTSQSVRRITKITLDGTERWGYNTNNHTAYLTTLDSYVGEGLSVISTHYESTTNKTAYTQLSNLQCCLRADGNFLWIRDETYSNVDDFKSWLAAQYAAGTPVTVYYVLAEPQTTTLNEPLMKIGDYADSVTYSSNIPTTYGQNDITTDTQIKPSKLDITYNALRRAKVYKNNRWILNPSIDWSQTLKISDLQSKKIKEMEGEYIGYNIHT